MKKFLLKIAPFVAVILLLEIALPIVVDPYNVFHWRNIRDNGVEPNKNFIKMSYILENPDRFDSFVFGSSRVEFLDVTRLTDGNYYNMCYSEGLPAEHYENLKILIANGIIPKNVLMGVDNISCFVPPSWHEGQHYRIAYPEKNKLGFYANYLNFSMITSSLSTILNHVPDDPYWADRFYETGSASRQHRMENDWSNDAPYWSPYYENYIYEAIEDIKSVIELCEEYDINLTIFTNPIYKTTYEKSYYYGYGTFLAMLGELTDFYNFSGKNDITTNQDNYWETSHYKMEVGDLMIDFMKNGYHDEELESQGFGMHVTDENFDQYNRMINWRNFENEEE